MIFRKCSTPYKVTIITVYGMEAVQVYHKLAQPSLARLTVCFKLTPNDPSSHHFHTGVPSVLWVPFRAGLKCVLVPLRAFSFNRLTDC